MRRRRRPRRGLALRSESLNRIVGNLRLVREIDPGRYKLTFAFALALAFRLEVRKKSFVPFRLGRNQFLELTRPRIQRRNERLGDTDLALLFCDLVRYVRERRSGLHCAGFAALAICDHALLQSDEFVLELCDVSRGRVASGHDGTQPLLRITLRTICVPFRVFESLGPGTQLISGRVLAPLLFTLRIELTLECSLAGGALVLDAGEPSARVRNLILRKRELLREIFEQRRRFCRGIVSISMSRCRW